MKVEICFSFLVASVSAIRQLPARDTSNVPADLFNPNGAVIVDTPDSSVERRQDIDFDLIDATPDPTSGPEIAKGYDATAAIAAVVSDVINDPLPQDANLERRSRIYGRDIRVATAAGYTAHTSLGNFAINAPRDCAGTDTYMGVKIFTSGPYDTTLCAAACSAQSAYNLKNPPATGKPRTCQFYQTYASYKNNVYQGQYCAMYTATWNSTFATNKGQYRGSDLYTIQDSYISSNATKDGITVCARGCATPYWGNSVTCGKRSTQGQTCWCNADLTGVGYCTENEVDGVYCKKDADCGAGGICMAHDVKKPLNGGICALGKRVTACI